MKWILIIVIALIVIAALFGGDSDSDSPSNSNPKKVESESKKETKEKEESRTDEESAVSKDSESEEDQEPDNEFKVGDVVETSDLRISFTGSEEYASDNEFMQPESGNVFYKMDFEFENISDSNESVSSWNFTCYADGYDMEQRYIDGMDLDATLSPGKKTKGSVFFEVPEGSEEIVLEYETNAWTEDKVVFIVK